MISAWADRGAPEGDAKDKPQPVAFNDDGWLLGQPDLIIQMKPYTVPKIEKNARGIVEDKIPFVKCTCPQGSPRTCGYGRSRSSPATAPLVHDVGVDGVSPDHPQIKGKNRSWDIPTSGPRRPTRVRRQSRI